MTASSGIRSVDAPGPQSPEAAVASLHADVARLLSEISRRFVGNPEVVDLTVTALLAAGHVLIEGAPGVGKTLLVRTLAEALELSFSRIQFTPDLMPADIIGTTIIMDTGAGRRFEFQVGPVFCQVLLADEINRATPKTQSALLEAMQERAVTVGRTTHPLPAPFFVMATQNPIEMEGTYPLPEAELDRFLFKVTVPPPDRASLHEILDRTTGARSPTISPVLTGDRMIAMQDVVRQVPVAHPIQDFVVRLIEASHPERTEVAEVKRWLRYGSSPRGAQALLLGAKVRALLDGRLTPSFADVRRVARPALRHRLLLNFDAEAENVTTDAVIELLLDRVADV